MGSTSQVLQWRPSYPSILWRSTIREDILSLPSYSGMPWQVCGIVA